MSERTGIEWTEHTFNVAWGCMKVSPGCAHCYADTLSKRYGHDVWGPASTTPRRTFGDKHWNEPLRWNRRAQKRGVGARVFCSSMADVFEDHPTIIAQLPRLWALVRATPWLTWLILTKRPERIAAHLPSDWDRGYPNVWLGTSVESQEYVERIAHLGRVPALIRFVSAEPLLGPLDLTADVILDGENMTPAEAIDWCIVGGESGPGARPMREEWVRSLRDQCGQFLVSFFLKQLGGYPDKRGHEKATLDGLRYVEWPSL